MNKQINNKIEKYNQLYFITYFLGHSLLNVFLFFFNKIKEIPWKKFICPF